jgi:allantoinase
VVVAIAGYDDPPAALARVDLADDQVLIPGLVDSHVHINEPGRTEWRASRPPARGAAGGVTTLVDMPLNLDPGDDNRRITRGQTSRRARQGACRRRVLGGIVPGNLADLAGLHHAGVVGFKAFLVPSGVDEFPSQLCRTGRSAPDRAALGRALTVVHAEDPAVIDAATPPHGTQVCGLRGEPPARGRGPGDHQTGRAA